MSAEHITNQSHLKESTNRLLNTESRKLNSELAKEINQNTKVQTIKQLPTIETNTIQQLLSQQSEQTKQNITKKSYEYMQQANALQNPEVLEQLEQEVDMFFNKKMESTIKNKTI